MKSNSYKIWLFIAYACAWLATGTAVTIAIVYTGRIAPLWALLIPGMLSINTSNGGGEDS